MRQRGEATVAAVEVVVVVVVKDAEHRRTGTRCIHDESGEPVSGLEWIAAFENQSCWRFARRPYTREWKRRRREAEGELKEMKKSTKGRH